MQKTENIYALLVGINQYEPTSKVNPLRGCVNDVQTMKAYLEERISKEINCEIKTLINEQATYAAIVDGFKNHLGKAKSNRDTILFCYSGHGSQEPAPEVFWHLEPDRKNETLVCYDSRTPNGKDLADKELAYLIGELAKQNPHIVVILDSCHSGSGTRDLFQLTETRSITESTELRSINSYVFPATQLDFPRGKHIVLSACRDYQKAREFKDGDSNDRGAFSHFLTEALKRSNGNVSYRDLFQETNVLIRGNISEQSPQIESILGDESDSPFLGAGSVAERQHYFTASYNRERGWEINGGGLHGVTAPTQGQYTRLALFPFSDSEGNPSDLTQLRNAVAEVNVTKVEPAYSKLSDSNLDRQTSYKAVVISQPISPMLVYLEGDEQGVVLVQQAIQTASAGKTHSLYVEEVNKEEKEKAQFRVIAQKGEYEITRPTDSRPLVEQAIGYTALSAAKVIKNLEHIDRWRKVNELSREANSIIPTNGVNLMIMYPEKDEEMPIMYPEKDGKISGASLRLEYKDDEDPNKQKPRFRVKLKNTTDKPLFCAIVNLRENFAIKSMLPGGAIKLEPYPKDGHEVWVRDGKAILGSVPDHLSEQGITEITDILKVIACTTDFEASLLEQGELGIPLLTTRSISRGKGGTLNHLFNQAITRNLDYEDTVCDDWIAKSVTVTIVRPKTFVTVNAQTEANLKEGVAIKPHPSFAAKARLTTIPQSSRDLDGYILPNILQKDYDVMRPFSFTTTRGSDPGLTALELSDLTADAIASITPETPLQITVSGASLAAEESLLAIAYDGEFFLPVGLGKNKDQGIEISLKHLPSETVSEDQRSLERSLGGSIRIFFQKVISKRLKLEFAYPLLSAVNVRTNEKVDPYDSVEVSIREKVTQSKRIVLFIHGIIGDTESMVPSVQRSKVQVNEQEYPLFHPNVYDLVLAFDYENLNTSIMDNARSLKERLEAVGLGKGHGKTLHIVAHSMGGLVSRWFIEREGGKDIVEHLIMLGTPNNGSPWPNVVDFALPLLTIGLNGLAVTAWPVSAIGALMSLAGGAIGGVERNMTTALKEMQEASALVNTLYASESPGISYTVIAGNTSIKPKGVESQEKLKALLNRLGKFVVESPFGGEDNDIAVKVESITHLPPRVPETKITEVACDHLTYFSDPAGLAALAKAVEQALKLDLHPSSGVIVREELAPVAPEDIPQQALSANAPTISQVTGNSDVGNSNVSSVDEAQETNQASSATSSFEWSKWTFAIVATLLGAISLSVIFLWKQPQNQQPQDRQPARQSRVNQL